MPDGPNAYVCLCASAAAFGTVLCALCCLFDRIKLNVSSFLTAQFSLRFGSYGVHVSARSGSLVLSVSLKFVARSRPLDVEQTIFCKWNSIAAAAASSSCSFIVRQRRLQPAKWPHFNTADRETSEREDARREYRGGTPCPTARNNNQREKY